MDLGTSVERTGAKRRVFDLEIYILTALLRDRITTDFGRYIPTSIPELVQLELWERLWVTLVSQYTRSLPQHMRKNILDELRDPVLLDVAEIGKAFSEENIANPVPGLSKEIRIIELYPSDDRSSVIHCKLCKVSLDVISPPKYVVLSYAWGDISGNRPIKLSGKDLKATEGLESALRQLRHWKMPQMLWVDAFCINPGDSYDHNSIVKRLKFVYTHAREVVVWLGTESITSGQAFAFIKEFTRALSQEQDTYSRNTDIIRRLISHPIHSACWEAVHELLQRPWWNRHGIFREFLYGSNIKVQCGSDIIDWKILPALFFSALARIRFSLRRLSASYPAVIDQIMSRILILTGVNVEQSEQLKNEEPVALAEAITSDICQLFSGPYSQLNPSSTMSGHFGFAANFLSALSVRLSGQHELTCRMNNAAGQENEPEDNANKPKPAVSERKLSKDTDGSVSVSQELRRPHCLRDLGSEIQKVQQLGNNSDSLVSKSKEIAPQVFKDKATDLECWLRIFTAVSGRKGYGRIVQAEDTSCSAPRTNFKYSYEELNVELQEIRVLELYPSDDPKADICCELIPINLALLSALKVDRLPYAALSYVWGQPDPPKTIFIHGKEKTVTPSLFAALREIRNRSVSSLLWVDALCIDQDNIEERNYQVGLMDLIYKKAGSVLMWLGEEEDDAHRAMELLSFIDQNLPPTPKYLDPAISDIFVKLVNSAGSTAQWWAMDKLLQREYWTRVWIMQEVVLARNPILCCGPYAVSFMVIVALRKFLGTFPPGIDGILDCLYMHRFVHQLADTYERRSDGATTTLLDSLLQSRERFATVTHDYIYGALGIVGNDSVPLTVDYSKSFFSVSKDVFEYIINQDSNLDVLSACEKLKTGDKTERFPFIHSCSSHHISGERWPSWLPDWSCKPPENISSLPMRSILLSAEDRPYRTAGETKPMVNFPDDGLLFSVGGRIFDSVEHTAPTALYWRGAARDAWDLFMEVSLTSDAYGSAEARKSAFAWTTFLGRNKQHDIISAAQDYLGFSFNDVRVVRTGVRQENDTSKAIGSTMEDKNCGKIAEGLQFDDGEKHENRRIEKDGRDKKSLGQNAHDNREVVGGAICALYQTSFFITKTGFIGRGPESVHPGDQVCIFLGAKVPFVLRENDESQRYLLLGESYVHGIMNGEAAPEITKHLKEFTLE